MTLLSGAVLFQLGADADQLYVIERGRVEPDAADAGVRAASEDVLVEERVAGPDARLVGARSRRTGSR